MTTQPPGAGHSRWHRLGNLRVSSLQATTSKIQPNSNVSKAMERSEWRIRRDQYNEQVPIDPKVSHDAQLMAWLAALNVRCKFHKQTRLTVHEAASREASLPQPLPTGEYAKYWE